MARPTTIHVCSSCGHSTPRWSGRCPGCGEWNTLVEEAARAGRVAGRGRARRRGGGRGGRAGAAVGGRHAPGPAAADRHRRVRPRARRRDRPGLARAARRLAGHRQVDADEHGARQPRRRRAADALRLGRGVAGADQAARRAPRRRARSTCRCSPRPTSRRCWRRWRPSGPRSCVIDSVQTLHASELTGAPGSVGQVREVASRIMQVAKAHAIAVAARRPRDEGGLAGRPARARAPRRLRPAVRGRARADLPDAARAEEPLRLDERVRRVRDALRRAGRGARRLGAVRRRGDPRAGLGRARRRWRARGRCSSRSRRWSRRPSSCRRGASSTASTATAWRSCWPCSARHAGVGVGTADVFVNVVGGVRVDEPGADLAVALAVAVGVARRRGGRRAGRAAAGGVRRGGPDGRAALGRPRRPPPRGGREVRHEARHRPAGQRRPRGQDAPRGDQAGSRRRSRRRVARAPRRMAQTETDSRVNSIAQGTKTGAFSARMAF